MKEMRLVALGVLSAALAACSSDVGNPSDGDGTTPPGTSGSTASAGKGPGSGTGGAGSTPPGSGGTSSPPGTAGSGNSSAGAPNLPPSDTCVPGIPPTSQIPRLLNRQYEAVVRDLLGVTTVGTDGKPLSKLLVNDSDGPMTPDAWRIYQDVAGQVAKAVMTGPNKSKFISCDPAAMGCLKTTIQTFGRKAFRRPLTDAEVTRFEKLSQTTPAGTPAEVAETTLQAFLVSPSFLWLPELTATQDPAGMGIQLSPHEVAARLSFLLWDSVPDDMLNAAADNNELQTKEQILSQAQRMIAAREKTGPLVAAFHRDWVQMNNGSAHWWGVDHDPAKYPLYSKAAKPSWQAELDAFFQDVAYSNGSFKDLLLSNVAFVNKDNAAIYGLEPADYGTELTKVQLDATQRPGFLTRVGFLSSYANYDATSPILRGAFITIYMLGGVVGAPIPGATMMTVQGDFKTQRAYVEKLTEPAACAGCHTVINPPGFLMENYDGIGQWQTKDLRGGPIDASVTSASVNGKAMTSAVELMQEIAQSPKAKERYAQAWVSYAFGRPPNGNDQCVVQQLSTKLAQDGTILNLLADLSQADAFRVRVRQTP